MGNFVIIGGKRIRIRADITVEVEVPKQKTKAQKRKLEKVEHIYENLQENNILLPRCKNLTAERFLDLLLLDFENVIEETIILEILKNFKKFFNFTNLAIVSYITANYEEITEEEIVATIKKVIEQINNKIKAEDLKIKKIEEFIMLFNYCKTTPKSSSKI